jgi:hypothetical protein
MPVLENIIADTLHVDERRHIEQILSEVVTPDGVVRWMNAPNPMLDDLSPTMAIAAGQGERVLELVLQVAEGIYV